MNFNRRDFLRRSAATALAMPVLAATAARAQTTHTVTIKNMAFTPANLQISVGDTVTWINEDRMPHSAWENSNDSFDTGLLSNGDSASVTFNNAGTFSYRCRPHGNMRATITVS